MKPADIPKWAVRDPGDSIDLASAPKCALPFPPDSCLILSPDCGMYHNSIQLVSRSNLDPCRCWPRSLSGIRFRSLASIPERPPFPSDIYSPFHATPSAGVNTAQMVI